MPSLTIDLIKGLKPLAGRDLFVWDNRLPGFGLRVKPGGGKSFLIQYRNRHGRSRRFTFGRYGVLTPDEARKRARQLLAAVAEGADPAADRASDRAALTVAALCDEYLAKARAGQILRGGKAKKGSTLTTDAGRIERHIKPLLGARAVKELTRQDVADLRDAMIAGKTAATVKTGKLRGVARVRGGAGTATRTLGLFGGILSYAVERGYRDDNPARGIEKPAYRKRHALVTAEQYRALGLDLERAAERGEPWQAVTAIWLLALTGCRRGEITNLKTVEIDRAARCLRLADTKTGASVRPIGSAALALIPDHGGEYVFPAVRSSGHEGAKPFGGLPNAWGRIAKAKELAGITPHTLRHGFSSMAEELGMSVPTIQALLGHSGRGVTAGYIHKIDASLSAAAEKVSAAIWLAMTGKSAEVVQFPGARHG
jgi:integrase